MSEMTQDVKPHAAVLGWPISHSLSPRLHGHWLEKYGIDGTYGTMAVMPEQLKDALQMMKDRSWRGCNLTLPLKEIALSMMDDHDESCLMAGAVNTVVIDDGKMTGYNSDGFGFVESLKAANPNWNGARTVIIGAGGAARGVVAGLAAAGARKFIFANRTRAKAEQIVKAFRIDADVYDWEERKTALQDATLLVNCSSLGMDEQQPLDLDLKHLPETATVCDIVYRPLRTQLLKDANRRGNIIVEGLPMLLHQGRLGFEKWFGTNPEVTQELHDEIAADVG
jgi:shikimate dehydrogenase